MRYISSFLFSFLINSWGAIIPIIYFPAFIIRSRKLADNGAKVWSVVSIWMLKKICRIDHKILGLENLPKGPCIIACKHQSMWETVVMHLIFKHPAYAYKKELTKIPFYGWYLGVMSGIKVDRKGGARALKDLIKQSKFYLNNNQNIVIFPQGTRVPVDGDVKQYPYQAGIAALYLSCKVPVVTVALNSGIFWPKKGVKRGGQISIKFLKPIESGLKKGEFMKKLEDDIEKESVKLVSAG